MISEKKLEKVEQGLFSGAQKRLAGKPKNCADQLKTDFSSASVLRRKWDCGVCGSEVLYNRLTNEVLCNCGACKPLQANWQPSEEDWEPVRA